MKQTLDTWAPAKDDVVASTSILPLSVPLARQANRDFGHAEGITTVEQLSRVIFMSEGGA